LFLTENGNIYFTGFGQYIPNNFHKIPQHIDIGKPVSIIAVGLSHSMAIDCDGFLWGWGSNSYGELGIGIEQVSFYRFFPTTLAQ
jgi:alpha-tubulin suppressor-like RCC1 family protein